MASKPDPFRSLGFAAISWIEHYLVHGPGDVQGQPIELDDEFAAFVVKSGEVDAVGRRKVRRAFLSRAKGRAKSEMAAMIECYEALGPCRFDHWAEAGEVSDWGYEYEDGEPVGAPLTYVEALNVATEEDQAGNTYDNVHFMLGEETCSLELLADYGRVDVGLTRINLPNKRGFIQPVTSADSSKDGGKSTFIVADETHLWVLPRLKRLHSVMTRNLLKRKVASGWMLETSTMYGDGEGSVAEGTHAYALTLSRNDRTLLFDHQQAADHWDLDQRDQRLKALSEAYGPAAEWMNLEAIADSWDDPQTSEADFRRYWLNQPVQLDKAPTGVIDLQVWNGLRDNAAPAPDRATLVLEVAQDRKHASIGVAADGPDGKTLVMVDHRRGTGWVVAAVQELQRKRSIVEVALRPASQAGTLIPDLMKAGVDFETLTGTDRAGACGAAQESIKDCRWVHVAQAPLDAAVKNAKTKIRGEGEVFVPVDPLIDISPIDACSQAAARWALTGAQPFNIW